MLCGEPQPEFCVIGIGASAGGLDALRTFFSGMPATPGFACVVVVHLSPEHESHLVQMLQSHTQMPVSQVVGTSVLEPNHVYVIPPNTNLTSIDTHLRLTQLEGRRVKRAPIDQFLRSLADTHGERAIGVILSGAGSDGALGIRKIKEHGGLTLAQDPRDAEYGSMPQAAIATGTVDLVAPPGELAEEICAYCASEPRLWKQGPERELAQEAAALLEKILTEVRQRTGQEFAPFRREMLLPRVRRRMRVRHVGTLEEYLTVLQSHAGEARALHDDLLLTVTDFFRDTEFYASIEQVLRESLQRAQERRIRIWTIGCSTGEEAYSIAMLLMERAGGSEQRLPQVFASELASELLQQAREGVYPQEIAASVSQERLEKFFIHDNGRYRVRRELRDLVTFASHDLFQDPPYSHLDLIVCRRLLRDLQPAMRRAALSLFYYALEPHGVLIIDPQDEVEVQNLFTRDSAQPGLLRRRSGPRHVLHLPPGFKSVAHVTDERAGTVVAAEGADTASIFRRAVERYTPPSLLLDADNHVVHFSVNAARYVRLPGGELTLDALRLLPVGISRRLKDGLQVVRRERRAWHSDPFVVLLDGRARRLTLRIDPASPAAQCPELLLVVFDDAGDLRSAERTSGEQQMLEQMLKLQSELKAVQQQLAVLSRDPASPPRPQAAPQPDQELHSLVEELDGAREELQVVNEELISVNQENQSRIETLAGLSHDLQHLLETSGLAMVLLNRELEILRFTPLAADLLRLKESDVGRPLADLKHHLRYEKLVADMRPVVEQLADVELEVESDAGRWYLVRAQPYRTAHRGLEGVTLLLIDITDRKSAELALREADRRKEEFLAVLAHELRNPLAPIVAGLEVLRKLPEDPSLVQRVSATMARQAKQLVRLVDDLLEVVRINEDKLTLRIQAVSVSDVVRDAVTATRSGMENLEHELTVEMPEEPLTVEGDAARLTQVIGNLLNNAARYTPPRGRIALRVARHNGNVVITVQDNGQGLTAPALEHVFEMFYQAGEPGVRNCGLGIGLTLARKLVEMHGGTIAAQSDGPGRGSTFTVTLPLARRETTGPITASHLGNGEAARAHRVLIVDDNEDAAETLRLLMKSMGGGDVRTASNGPEALATAAKLLPDVVLLDLGMPGMDGYELARRMRAEAWGKEALLVALTGWGQEQHRRRSQEAGFDRHMIKPADADALRSVLDSC